MPAASARQISAAARAVYLTFGCSGIAVASWASRIPQVRDGLGLTPSTLGLVLLSAAVGSLLAVPSCGALVARYGSRRVLVAATVLLGVGLLTVSFGYLVSVLPVVCGLFLVGMAFGAWEVALNVQGAAVERMLGRAILARFHAGFSIGTVAGALIGVGMVTLRVPVTAHLAVAGVLVVAVVLVLARSFLPDRDGAPGSAGPRPHHGLDAWLEPRTLLIGVLALAFALAEGTGGDWIGVAVIDSYGAPAEFGTLAYAVFLAAMMVGRWFGPRYLDRYGRVAVLRTCAALGIAGILLFVFGAYLPVAFLGALLWGAGASLGFPTGMSASADDPDRAAARVSVAASIGYFAFLAGPTMVGFLGSRVTVLRALTTVAVFLLVAALIAGATRPLRTRDGTRGGSPRTPPGTGG